MFCTEFVIIIVYTQYVTNVSLGITFKVKVKCVSYRCHFVVHCRKKLLWEVHFWRHVTIISGLPYEVVLVLFPHQFIYQPGYIGCRKLTNREVELTLTDTMFMASFNENYCCVNKQPTQLSMYHLMQHVLSVKRLSAV